jgi:hypothetical protein
LQDVISSPLLIGGHKFSLRLYALITSAEPLRVYLHEDGFALFASRPYNASDAADPRSFLTNAYQNRRSASAVVGAGDGGGGAASVGGTGAPTTARMLELEADRRVARELGLQLPPRSCRWTLAQLLKFVAARQVDGGGGGRSSAADNSSLVGSSAAAARVCASVPSVSSSPARRLAAVDAAVFRRGAVAAVSLVMIVPCNLFAAEMSIVLIGRNSVASGRLSSTSL